MLLDLSDARLHAAALHYIGNKNSDEGCFISDENLWLQDENQQKAIRKFAVSGFAEGETWRFTHTSEIGMNETYVFCKRLFENPEDILAISSELAKHLYEKSDHPQVKPGEFMVAVLENCFYQNQVCKGIALIKIEHKDLFMRLRQVGQGWDIQLIEGLQLQKPDRACLVLELHSEDGYTLLLSDKTKGNETQYWKDEFLQIKPAADSYNFTSSVMKVTKEFVTKEMPDEFPVSKTDSMELLSRSMDYFKTNDQFDKKSFAESVFQDDRMIDSFMKYEEDYCKYHELPSSDHFEINNTAVKKQAKIYKSILKLDKNFHIYIHGNREMIQKGTDPDGRKFYKIYFENEE